VLVVSISLRTNTRNLRKKKNKLNAIQIKSLPTWRAFLFKKFEEKNTLRFGSQGILSLKNEFLVINYDIESSAWSHALSDECFIWKIVPIYVLWVALSFQ